ncbi:MAG: hypothetical protein ACTSUE_16645 [Promethearchaeota archaeon]
MREGLIEEEKKREDSKERMTWYCTQTEEKLWTLLKIKSPYKAKDVGEAFKTKIQKIKSSSHIIGLGGKKFILDDDVITFIDANEYPFRLYEYENAELNKNGEIEGKK